jgi:hypothetical protein
MAQNQNPPFWIYEAAIEKNNAPTIGMKSHVFIEKY